MASKNRINDIDWTLDERSLRKQLLKLTKPQLIKLCKTNKVAVSINGSKQDMISNLINNDQRKSINSKKQTTDDSEDSDTSNDSRPQKERKCEGWSEGCRDCGCCDGMGNLDCSGCSCIIQ